MRELGKLKKSGLLHLTVYYTSNVQMILHYLISKVDNSIFVMRFADLGYFHYIRNYTFYIMV